MKLQGARVRNYRIHKDITVTFDPRITLVSGPNESGKSTLAEAIHRALFFRAKAGGEVRERMTSAWGEPPGVTVEFEAGGKSITVAKSFRGGRGECSLTIAEEGVLSGDAAEERLAELLKSKPPIGGHGAETQLGRRWAHLWVWQGSAGAPPGATVAEEQDALLQRLQGQGGASVIQSPLDSSVLGSIRDLRNRLLTENGAPRKDSDLARAEGEVDTLQASVRQKQQTLDSLEEAVARYTRAVKEIEAKTLALETGNGELVAVREKLGRADALVRHLETIERREQELAALIAELERVARELADARRQGEYAAARLAPLEEERARVRNGLETLREALRHAEHAWEAARAAESARRKGKDALDAHLLALEKEQELARLKTDQAAIAAKRQQLQAVRDEMARTPLVETEDLAALQDLLRGVAAAEAACLALGARMEVLASREPVTVDGAPVASGETRVITDDADVAIGSAAKLRIRPGGTTGIAEARQAAEKARQAYTARLATLGVPSPEAAAEAREKMRVLAGKKDALEADLDRLNAGGNEDAVRACEQARSEAVRRAEQAAADCGRALPPDLPATREAAETAAREGVEAGQVAAAAEAAFRTAREKSEDADLRMAAANVAAEEARREVQDAAVRIRTIEEQHGDDASRGRRLLDLRAQRDEAAAGRNVVQQRLQELQPDQLRADVARLEGAIRQAQDAIGAARQQEAAAAERLKLSGTLDPREDLEKTRAAWERAGARARELRARADAVRHLADVAGEVQRSIAERLVKPLEDAAQGYLECVFGAGARAVLSGGLRAGEDARLRVVREQAGLGTFEFDGLSAGAREQVGVAMRLAMAEVLAADHGGSLPVVLDDAFTNSDPDRVRILQRMLYRAASRGLQVIVLTSNPAGYTTLGAAEIRLARPSFTPALSVPGPAARPAEADAQQGAEAPATPATGGEELFLAKLRELGGKCGNQRLREGLDWATERYEAVKTLLLAAGRIGIGQGRGGSVRLAEAGERTEREEGDNP